MSAPIAIFAYNRPSHLEAVLDALAQNPQARDSDVHIFCDGPKTAKQLEATNAVRAVADNARGFGRVEVVKRPENWGLSRSIVSGVSEICDRYGSAIVLEDDVVPTPFFLGYVNDALVRYRDDARVASVGCHTFDSGMELPETFFLDVPDCWGWGVWKRSWDSYEADGAALLARIREQKREAEFDFDGTYPYLQMLADQVLQRNDSWAVRWYARTFIDRSLTLYPRRPVTQNIGFDGSGVHGGRSPDYVVGKLLEAPISVHAVALERSDLAREAWKTSFRQMLDKPKASLMRRIQRRIVSLAPWR